MTHQEIAAEIEALGNKTIARREAISDEHRAQMSVIREKCGAVGHIFKWSMSFQLYGSKKEDSYACAVCGAPRREAMKAAA